MAKCSHVFAQYFGPIYKCTKCNEQKTRDICKKGVVFTKYPEPPYRKEIPKPDYAPALRYDIKEDEL